MRGATPAHTPRERLASWRVRLSRALYAAIGRNDTTQAAVAEACGTAPQKVQTWCDHHRPEGPSLAHLALMPRGVLVDLLAPVLEEHGLLAIERPPTRGTYESHIQRLHEVISECNDVPREYTAALASHGGVITDEEARRIEREIDEAMAALAAARFQIRSQRIGAEAAS